jgi:sRNA-binding carbon storage regulator CsrA
MCLAFSRKLGQGFWVGESFVKLDKGKGDSIKVVVTAPPEVSVDRAEVRARKQRTTATIPSASVAPEYK